MKGHAEFKGYRTCTTYDPKSGEFIAQKAELPGFEISPSKPELNVPKIHLGSPGESSVKPRKPRKFKSTPRVSARSLAMSGPETQN